MTPPGKPDIINTRYGGIAQLVRAPASHVGGHRFESCCPHHRKDRLTVMAGRFFVYPFFWPASATGANPAWKSLRHKVDTRTRGTSAFHAAERFHPPGKYIVRPGRSPDGPFYSFISGCSAAGSAPALGAGCRRFKSCHSDQTMIIRTPLSKWVMCSDLSFLLRIFYNLKAG